MQWKTDSEFCSFQKKKRMPYNERGNFIIPGGGAAAVVDNLQEILQPAPPMVIIAG